MLIFGDLTFEEPREIIRAFTGEELATALPRLDELRQRLHVVGYIRYEAHRALSDKSYRSTGGMPLLWFAAFDKGTAYRAQAEATPGYIKVTPQTDFPRYSGHIERIREAIAAGRTYQVNYTYACTVEAKGLDSRALYERLRQEQPTPYSAYLENEYETILSCSPELFFEVEGQHILTRPMKGTMPRGETEEEDARLRHFLEEDAKNRAENLMIVDLLRNDLGRICRFGSVQVPELYAIETHSTVHQMTSSVTGELEAGIGLQAILEAIFPCGSITGAPKVETMKLIETLEQRERGVYCGAIAYLNPEKLCFSVPIRMLQQDKGSSSWTYGVGSGIVWDSRAESEWEECRTKTAFLQKVNPDFEILETMLLEDGKTEDLELHLQRMEYSADYFGYPFDRARLPLFSGSGMLRLLLDADGHFRTELHPVKASGTHKVRLSDKCIKSSNPYLGHKTTYRPWYAEDMERIRKGEVFDVLHFNERGELGEGARCNVVLELDGHYYTPPLSCGLLGGTQRTALLLNGRCRERVLYREDLERATRIYCINAVRGMVEVELMR
ncbi:MAG: aminodeoxychorismate synthase component I [Opitutales bacterium]|nr:aminodeoxychorismate synthase component I [Opitutales bacterium]